MITRFKRGGYVTDNPNVVEPKWHVAVQDYKRGGIYRRYLALCGYEVKMPWRYGDMKLSKAKRVRGPQCSKCLKKLTEEKA